MFATTVQGVRRIMIIFSVFLIGVIFSQGCVSKKAYNTIIDELDACQVEKKSLRTSVDGAKSQNEILQNRLAIEKKQKAKMHAHYEGLVSVLETEVVAGQITVEEMKSGVVLNLPEKVLFPSGSNELSEVGHQMLMKIGAEIQVFPYQILVSGFTDNVAIGVELAKRYPTNWDLAGARASTVVCILEKAGVAKEKMRAISAGENNPIASNDTEDGRRKNRRVEIRIRPVEVEED